MNNYYVLYHLAISLRKLLIHQYFFTSVSPHKGVWHGQFGTDRAEYRLVFSSHPSETALFLDSVKPLKKRNITTFFHQLHQEQVNSVDLAENDRHLTISFTNQLRLLFTPFGNKPNLFLLDKETILDSFKLPGYHSGRAVPPPRSANPIQKIPKEGTSVKKIITSCFPLFPRHLIQKVTACYALEEKKPEEVIEILNNLTENMLIEPDFRVLNDGSLCLIPEKALPARNLKRFSSINEAVAFTFYQAASHRRFAQRVNSVKPLIEKKLLSLQRRLEQLQQTVNDSTRAEQFEKLGHILMANAHSELNTENGTVTLPDYYNSGKPVRIPVDESLSVAANAEAYYNKSSRAERSAKEAKRRLEDTAKELTLMEELSESLAKVADTDEFNIWAEKYEPALELLGLGKNREKAEPLPFRKTNIGGFEIWIGKNAKSNDKLTQAAHKEDLWLHARGVSGSHVVIRMNNQQAMPPKEVLLKTASAAAYYSGARNSSLVPVSITRRKYVTKPKGAAAGAVRIQRETVELVKPGAIS